MTATPVTVIAGVQGALPPHRYTQQEVTDTFLAVPAFAGLGDVVRGLHEHAKVEARHFVLPLERYPALRDFGDANDIYLEHALDLGVRGADGGARGGRRGARRPRLDHHHDGDRHRGALAGRAHRRPAGIAPRRATGPAVRAGLRRRGGRHRAPARLPARGARARRGSGVGRTVFADLPRRRGRTWPASWAAHCSGTARRRWWRSDRTAPTGCRPPAPKCSTRAAGCTPTRWTPWDGRSAARACSSSCRRTCPT